MRNKLIYSLAFVSALFTIASCNDDDEKPASLLGGWKGDKTEASVTVDGFPAPLVQNDENFDGQAEFKSDGTIIFKEDGKITEGTWSQNGKTLILSLDDDIADEDNVSGTYTIKELTSTRLKLYIEKDAILTDDDSGLDFLGHVKATLYFDRK